MDQSLDVFCVHKIVLVKILLAVGIAKSFLELLSKSIG